MSSSNNDFGTISSFLNTSLLRAISEAGSHVPSGPVSLLADLELGYKINTEEEPSSLPPSSSLPPPPPPPPPPTPTPTPPPNQPPADEHVKILISHLLTWPQANPGFLGIVTIGLPLVMKCLGQHMVYDATRHRVRLREDSEVRLRGGELGLPKGYLAWLCADEDEGATNVLRIGVWELKAGERRLRRVWSGGGRLG